MTVENVEGIRSEILKVFMEKFKEEVVVRPTMKGSVLGVFLKVKGSQ